MIGHNFTKGFDERRKQKNKVWTNGQIYMQTDKRTERPTDMIRDREIF